MGDEATQDGKPDEGIGDGVGGADTSGSGNILAGVQPDAESDDQEEERREE